MKYIPLHIPLFRLFITLFISCLLCYAPTMSALHTQTTPDNIAPPDSISQADTIPPPPLDVPAKVGIIIRDLSSGEDIVERNPDMPLSPASITKCLTAACCMLDGKEDMCFTTSAYIEGAVRDRQLYGNLVIMASGDPTTESRHFPSNKALHDSIAAHVSNLGIDSIRGQIIFDSSIVPESGPSTHWMTEDFKWSYGAGHYAINFRDNTVGADRAMPDPPGNVYDALCGALESRGVYILDEEIDIAGKPTLIYSRRSPKGSEIMRSMMVRSDNMFAEGMLRSLSPGGNTDEAVTREKKLLASSGLNLSTPMAIYDGSGLARDNRLTPRFMSDLLAMMAKSPYAGNYIKLFPAAGEEGTVRRLLKDTPLAGRLVLKSGSMRGVQCYAGYKLDEHGAPSHVVVIMVNGFSCPRKEVVASAEQMLLDTFIAKDK